LPQERLYYEPTFGPDEKRAFMTSDDPPDSLWEIDVERGRARRVTLGKSTGPVGSPLWWRGGNRLVIATTSNGKPGIASLDPAGGALRTVAAGTLYADSLHPRDPILIADGPGPGGKNFDLFEVSLTDGKTRPVIANAGNDLRGQLSPEGDLLAYTSDETGRPEIFVQTWPTSQAKWQVTFAGGDQAAWRGDGKELFYLAPDGKLMSVSVQRTPAVAFGDPVLLFQTPLTLVSVTGNRNQYLASRDGLRFLLLEESRNGSAGATFIVNFAQLLDKSR
jgi:Tol biopolymer transport system component